MTEASTEIGRGKDANGNNLSGQNTSDYPECDENKVAVGSSQKPSENLAHGLAKFEGFRALELHPVRDQACQLFRSAQNENLLRGRSIEAIAAASVYGAYDVTAFSRLVGEVSEMARVGVTGHDAYKNAERRAGAPRLSVSR